MTGNGTPKRYLIKRPSFSIGFIGVKPFVAFPPQLAERIAKISRYAKWASYILLIFGGVPILLQLYGISIVPLIGLAIWLVRIGIVLLASVAIGKVVVERKHIDKEGEVRITRPRRGEKNPPYFRINSYIEDNILTIHVFNMLDPQRLRVEIRNIDSDSNKIQVPGFVTGTQISVSSYDTDAIRLLGIVEDYSPLHKDEQQFELLVEDNLPPDFEDKITISGVYRIIYGVPSEVVEENAFDYKIPCYLNDHSKLESGEVITDIQVEIMN